VGWHGRFGGRADGFEVDTDVDDGTDVNGSSARQREPQGSQEGGTTIGAWNDELVGGGLTVVAAFWLGRLPPGQITGCKTIALGKAGDQVGQARRHQFGKHPRPASLGDPQILSYQQHPGRQAQSQIHLAAAEGPGVLIPNRLAVKGDFRLPSPAA